MSEWIDFERWQECVGMERPGFVFEVANADDQTLLTVCMTPLPVPFDWQSPPLRFRAVSERPARHSAPIPSPLHAIQPE